MCFCLSRNHFWDSDKMLVWVQMFFFENSVLVWIYHEYHFSCLVDFEVELHHSSRWVCGAAESSDAHLLCEVVAGWTLSLWLPEACQGYRINDRGSVLSTGGGLLRLHRVLKHVYGLCLPAVGKWDWSHNRLSGPDPQVVHPTVLWH